MEMLELKLPRQEVFKEGAESPKPPSIAVPPLQAFSGLILSPLPITLPYLSPSFQGQEKLFLLPFREKGGHC